MKPSNLTESEYSGSGGSENDDVEIISAGKRSNYTNTSIVKMGANEDASSMNSGISGNFSYLHSYSNNMAYHRGKSPKHTSSVTSSRKNLHMLAGASSEALSQGQMVKINSCSSDDGLRSVEMAGLDGDESRQSGGNKNNVVHVISDTYDSDDSQGDPVFNLPLAAGGGGLDA